MGFFALDGVLEKRLTFDPMTGSAIQAGSFVFGAMGLFGHVW